MCERFGKQRSADFGCETERRALCTGEDVGAIGQHHGGGADGRLVIATVFVVRHNGFTVKFETDGGSQVDSVKVMHSETVSRRWRTREGGLGSLPGWYTDRDCTRTWDLATDTVGTV